MNSAEFNLGDVLSISQMYFDRKLEEIQFFPRF